MIFPYIDDEIVGLEEYVDNIERIAAHAHSMIPYLLDHFTFSVMPTEYIIAWFRCTFMFRHQIFGWNEALARAKFALNERGENGDKLLRGLDVDSKPVEATYPDGTTL